MDLRGLFVPLVTPLTSDDAVATGALERLALDVLQCGAAGIVALGTTGEAAALDDAERRTVVDVCAAVCRSAGAPLIVGAGTNDTRGSAAALRTLEVWPEITAALVPVPPFTRPTEAGVVAHFAHLSRRSPVPLVVYNVPCRTGRSLSAATLRGLAALPGVVGVKQAAGSVDAETVALLADPPPGFAVLAGDDVVAAPLLAIGAAGGVLASAHLCTTRFVDMVAAWRAGDAVAGRESAELACLSAALFAEPNPTVLKAVLHATGRIPTPAVRLPLLPAHPDAVAAALTRLDRLTAC
jgi:4-hydroxy-tetrahydrodipicolinate synthase